MAVAAAALGAIGVVSLHTNRPTSLVGGGGRPAASGPPTSAPSSGGGTTTVPTTTPPSGPLRSAVGKPVQYGYGVVSVKVTVRGNHIVDVAVASLQTPDPTSQSITDQAIPYLKSEVLSAQGARINAVSGATYTSEGYAYSLQSALDKLHVA
jgi:hypothetical protein